MLSANAAAPPRLSRSPRLSVELGLASSSLGSATYSSFRVDSLAERASCKALDESVEESVVEQRERNRRNEDRGHQRLPEEDVAADEVVRDPGRDGAVLGRRDEGERVDELVDAE